MGMSLIKSSLELAMERAQSIQVNPEELSCGHKRQEGAYLAAQALKDSTIDIKSVLAQEKSEDRICMIQGFLHPLILNLSLPANSHSLTVLGNVIRVIGTIFPALKQKGDLFLTEMHTYLDKREQATDYIRKHFTPMLKQKEKEITQQSGHSVSLQFEVLPEYQAALKEQMYLLEMHYKEVIAQNRWHIEQYAHSNEGL